MNAHPPSGGPMTDASALAAIKRAAKALPVSYGVRPIHHGLCDAGEYLEKRLANLVGRLAAAEADVARLDYIERTFSGMTNRERYLPVQMIWGAGANGRTLREACDKYMKRDALASTPEKGT